MEEKNNLGRVLLLLLLTMLMTLGLYALPTELFGYKIKKVDMLSDLRVKPRSVARDSLDIILARTEVIEVDTVALRDSVVQTTGIDSTALAKREALYNSAFAATETTDAGSRIEDFSPGHIGMKRFFAALNKRDQMDRPVRVAFMGDSFVEGDIVVADLRSAMQKAFGGRGVGFVPVTSVAAQFRPTVEQSVTGWKTWTMITDHDHRYTLPGMIFEPIAEGATLSLKNTNRYPELPVVSTMKLYYEQNKQTEMELVINAGEETIRRMLPPTTVITQNIQKGEIKEASFAFTQTEGFHALGVALEDDKGIVVDNYSLRGNSGLILDRLDKERCAEFTNIRPYDLIILQYGLNVISEDMIDYGWYGSRMVKTIRHIQSCFPEADILLLSVSDRSHQEDGTFETMPAVLSLLHTQRQAAKRAGIPFWNLFEAMGGENSMVTFVENNWASKDYTHLSFRGGKEIAAALMKAILKEKEFYDEAEKTIH